MKPVDPSTWRFGIPSDSIVRDAPEDGPAEASEPYYGGRLVAESMDVSEREFILRASRSFWPLCQLVDALFRLNGLLIDEVKQEDFGNREVAEIALLSKAVEAALTDLGAIR